MFFDKEDLADPEEVSGDRPTLPSIFDGEGDDTEVFGGENTEPMPTLVRDALPRFAPLDAPTYLQPVYDGPTHFSHLDLRSLEPDHFGDGAWS